MTDTKELEETINQAEDNENKMGSVKSKLKKIIKHSQESKETEEMDIATFDQMFMCGVVEGFYGRPWTAEQRQELFRRMEEMGLNSYLYGPKDDYKHRLFWREKYSVDESELLKTLIDAAEDHGVRFVYAISPGLDITFSSEKDVTALKEKLLQVKSLGCKAFALLFDDIDPYLRSPDLNEFHSSADAQASITNLMFNALGKPRFLFCPTEYCNYMACPSVNRSFYLKTIGNELDPMINVMWTGPKVVSNVISVDSIKQLNKMLKRRVMIWDNIHANDYDPKRVFLGPYKGRSTHLIPHLSGVLTNPNCEFESNFIAMHTIANWWKCHKPGSGEVNSTSDVDDTDVKNVPSTSNAPTLKEEKSSKKETAKTDSVELSASDTESFGSGRAGDTDFDSDSDYSFQDEDLFYSISCTDHGDYDPSIALDKALKDWLPVFSWLKYPTRKIVPRSGTPQVIPPISNVPLNTRPVVPEITVTVTVKDPVVSTGQIGDSSSNFIPKDINRGALQNDQDKAEKIDDTTKTDVEVDGVSEPCNDSVVPVANANENGEKLETDIDMALASSKALNNGDAETLAASPHCDTSKLNADKDSSIDFKPASPDVEMKEENSSSGNIEDKTMEAMQTSPKTTSTADQMDTDDTQELTTPMVTDDPDSDVSMATAQSGNAIATDEDMAVPSPATVNADPKIPEDDIKSPVINSFVKLEEIEANESIASEMSTPKIANSKEAILEKYESDPMTLDDLRMLAECFYLPYEHGTFGRTMVEKFTWLRETAFRLSRSSNKKSESFLDTALEWSEKALAFEEYCRDIQAVFNKVCTCPNRALLYDLYPYMWDLKGVIGMLRSYVQWLGRVEVRPTSSESESENKKDRDNFEKMGLSYLGSDPEPWSFRGGLSGEFQRLLPVSASIDLFCQRLPMEPQIYTFVVRPYVPDDEKSIYEICYATDNDGTECSEDFQSNKELPGDRLVGALLTLSPEYCFVAEDDTGVCGYLLGARDAKKFWKQYEIAYLPEMREKYQKPANTDRELNHAEKAIMEFYNEEDRFGYGSDGLSSTHPSFVTLALQLRANSTVLKSMLVCFLSALKSHHSNGVHTVLTADSVHRIDLYTKLGFGKLSSKDEDLLTKKNIKVLGRTF